MVTFKGQLYPGRHQPIVDTELFERVQRIIDNRMHPAQRDITHNHFLRGLMHCGHCRDAGRSHRLIYTEAVKRTDQASQIYEYYFCRGRQENDCDLPYLPTREVERAVGKQFAALTLSPETLSIARTEVLAALEQVLSSKAEQLKRLRKELKQVESQEERLVDLAADGSLATGKLRERLKEVQIRKNRIRDQLGSTDEELRTRTDTVLAYLDLLERPEALYVGASDSIKRQLLTAFFRRIWVDDDGHQAAVAVELQPLLAVVRDSAIASAQQKSTGEISSAHPVEQLNLYLQVICSSNANLVAGERFELSTSRL
ncbi:hypothetical protein HOW07_12400 [Plantibacter sp. MCCC 1A11337]|nr:hypothetical protein [Plantibacter sp. MCCC 1A11337]